MRELPIISEGQLASDAGYLVLGSMFYPQDLRSAWHTGNILKDEAQSLIHDENYVQGRLYRDLIRKLNVPLLEMVGRMALRIVTDHLEGRKVSKSQAAHIVSEQFSTMKTVDGQPLPTDPVRLRKTFSEYESVAHLWAITCMPMTDFGGRPFTGPETLNLIANSRLHLLNFLAIAQMVEELLKAILPSFQPIGVPDAALIELDVSQSGLTVEINDPVIETFRRSYKARSGR